MILSKILIRLLGVFVIAFFIFVISCHVLLSDPFTKHEWIRASDAPEKIKAGYTQYTCGGDCPHFYEIRTNGPHSQSSDEANELYLSLPSDIPDPELINFDLGCRNIIHFTAYRYKRIYKNIITGKIIEEAVKKIDVLEWQAEIPYCLTEASNTTSASWITKKIHNPLRYRTKKNIHKPGEFKSSRYNECCL